MERSAEPKKKHPALTNEEIDAVEQASAHDERERSERESWNFAIVGRESSNAPKYIAWANTKDGARQLRERAEILGWRKVTICGADWAEVKGDD